MQASPPSPRPLYPDIHVTLHSRHPLALIGAVRQTLRKAGVDRREIERFSRQAFGSEDPAQVQRICQEWVAVELPSSRAIPGSAP